MRIKFVKMHYWTTARIGKVEGPAFGVEHLQNDTFRIIAALRAWIKRHAG